jgi:carboxypeptidase family protein
MEVSVHNDKTSVSLGHPRSLLKEGDLMWRSTAVFLLIVGVAAPAAAQQTTGQIVGKVTDESAAVLPGVTVTIRGAGVAGAPTTVTSETGSYRFPVLPPGTYDLEYTLSGFGTLRRTAIPVSVGAASSSTSS